MADDDIDFGADLEAALDGGPPPEREDHREERQAKPDNPFPKSDDEGGPREYVREGRRFVPKEQEAKAVAEATGQETRVKEGEVQVKTEQGWRPIWLKPEHGLDWDKSPEPFRKALEERERAFAQAYQEKTGALKQWEPVAQLMEPLQQALRAQGVEPNQFLGQLVHAHNFLTKEPQQAMAWLAQAYGVDLNTLVQGMQQEQQQVDPTVKALQDQVAALSGKLTQRETQEQQWRREAEERDNERRQKEVEDWAKAKPHYEAVRPIMHRLALGYEGAGQQYSLDGLYDEACKLHPEVSQRILADQRKANVSRARAGQVSPRGQPVIGGRDTHSPKLTVEQEIAAQLDAMGA